MDATSMQESVPQSTNAAKVTKCGVLEWQVLPSHWALAAHGPLCVIPPLLLAMIVVNGVHHLRHTLPEEA